MGFSKRAYAGFLGAVGAGFVAILAYDVYDDWVNQGEPLVSTLLENSPPIVLALLFLYLTYWLYRNRSELYLAIVARWIIIGLVGVMFVLGWVLGNQATQSRFKPFVIVGHTAIAGGLAGIAIGYATASVRESRQSVATERDRWESLFQNDPGAIADLRFEDGTPVVEVCNESFTEFFRVPAAAAAGESLAALVDHERADIGAEIAETVEDGERYGTEVTVTGTESTHFKLRVVPYGIGEGKKRAFAIYTDVTELRETQQELETRMEDLEAWNERLQQFAYIASHDLQEPLRMVSSYMSLLESEYRDDLDEQAQEYIDFAADGADRMQAMIDGLLEYSRVETEGEDFTEVDATEELETAIQALELRIAEADATVSYDDLPAVQADRSQLSELFQNLIENAINHGPDGISVEIDAEHRNGEVVFSVSDDGPGIPESQQGGIFELFKRGDREGNGIGMGLAICDRIVSRHGGRMWVESAECEGATFYWTMPASGED